jgi:hypothetical protein
MCVLCVRGGLIVGRLWRVICVGILRVLTFTRVLICRRIWRLILRGYVTSMVLLIVRFYGVLLGRGLQARRMVLLLFLLRTR